jgi:KDO2-lipid IV(A) lauroyltransferase
VFAAASGLVARRLAARPGRHVLRWQDTIARATGVHPDRRLTEAGLRSYLRMQTEVLSLPRWSPERLAATVTTDLEGEAAMRAAMRDRGVVLALPHMGNWDLAGAWVCSTGLPVSTVAEQLPDREFQAFGEFRRSLGMRVHSHTDPSVLRSLMTDVREGRLVCLVADRDLSGRGVATAWPTPHGALTVTVPAGPALVARATGAVLMAIACHYTPTGMHIGFSAPIAHRAGAGGAAAMMQEVVEHFSGEVIRHPADWHVFQPFFQPSGR